MEFPTVVISRKSSQAAFGFLRICFFHPMFSFSPHSELSHSRKAPREVGPHQDPRRRDVGGIWEQREPPRLNSER